MNESHIMLNVETVKFDPNNPRIKMALEKYGERLDASKIHFALRSATENAKGTSSYSSLRDSIRASGGIMTPITVVVRDDEYICIDGNTRLAIYKQFNREETPGNWSEIKASVLYDADQKTIEKIRVSAHLVGAREWPAYEKARYLHYLRSEAFMEYNEMIALCGGNRTDIERQIEAYHDMNEFYRDRVDDTAFHIDRFSGFVELQKPKIKDAIFEAGLKLKDFGDWIRDGKIYRLADVRQLPKVLSDNEAREMFLNGGPKSIEGAIKHLDRQAEQQNQTKESETKLSAASVWQLVDTLARRINEMPYSEWQILRTKEHEDAVEQISNLENLSELLQQLLQNVSE